MQLSVSTRSCNKKLEARRLRTLKKIPAVLYNKGKESTPLALDGLEFEALIRSVPKGYLSTSVLNLKDENGKEFKAIIKEIQYHKTSYNVIHLDLVKLDPKEKVTVNVPVVTTNVVDCVGIKLGGQLRQLERQVRVECNGDQIPEAFFIDVKEMNVDERRRVKDLAIPKGVRPLVSENEVLVMITKK